MANSPRLSALCGILLAGLVVALAYGFYPDGMSPRYLAVASLKRWGIDSELLDELLAPPPLYVSRELDGTIRATRPRIIMPQLASWDGRGIAPLLQQRTMAHREAGEALAEDEACEREGLMNRVSCWLVTGDQRRARLAVDDMLAGQPIAPDDNGAYGDSWEWALALDLLAMNPAVSASERGAIAGKLRRVLRAHLRLLDEQNVSLWHGRSSLAAQAWLLAVAALELSEEDLPLARRAQGHFQQTLAALALAEAWPEGYTYWINSRAFLVTLAASAYINGLEDSQRAPAILASLRRVGLWTVYATRPDHRVEALGDEGARVDLKDETRRVIDIVAQVTGDSVFATYSAYLGRVHGAKSYYPGYRWGLPLFNDPAVPLLPDIERGSLVGLERYLPRAEIFGRGAMNLFIARSGWGGDDSLVTLRAGHSFTHHGHYDAGHFTLFKAAPLAVNSSTYDGKIRSPHRLGYAIQTVAKNSLLVLPSTENRGSAGSAAYLQAGGGQRVVMPTGSRVLSVEDWRDNLGAGRHYEGGDLLAFHLERERYAYLRVDLTGAYDNPRHESGGEGNAGRVRSAVRELLYLYDEDRLLVHDIVQPLATDATVKWLLHTVNRPYMPDSLLAMGDLEAGIMESQADWARIFNGPGRLDLKRIYPDNATMRLIGGRGFEYYVESGVRADAVAGLGANLVEGASASPWFDPAAWRLEVEPTNPGAQAHFLLALSPSIGGDRSEEVVALRAANSKAYGLATVRSVVLFDSGQQGGQWTFDVTGRQRRLLLVGGRAGDDYQVEAAGRISRHRVTHPGVLEIELVYPIRPGARIMVTRR